MNSIVIGFTGGTGSGKTTLAQRLNEVFKNNSVIIKQDSYYKDFPDKSFEERVQINYDHPRFVRYGTVYRRRKTP